MGMFWRVVSQIILLLTFFGYFWSSSISAQGFNVASTYPITDKEAISSDVLINGKEVGFVTTDVPYDARLFGVLQDNPIMVLRQATVSADMRPVIVGMMGKEKMARISNPMQE